MYATCPTNIRRTREDHRHLDRQHATRARDHQRTRFKFSVVCAYSLFSNITIHARWLVDAPNPVDAPSRQKWIDSRTTRAPSEKRLTTKSGISTAQACVDTAIKKRSARTERIRRRWLSTGRQSRTGSGSAEQRQEDRDLHDMWTFDSAVTATRRRARLPHSGYHAFLQGHGSDMRGTLLSAIRYVKPRLVRNGEQTLPRSQRALQGWKKLAPCYARLPLQFVELICHGGDRFPRQLETVSARDYDRLFCCEQQTLFHPRVAWMPSSDIGSFCCVRPNAKFPAALRPSTSERCSTPRG